MLILQINFILLIGYKVTFTQTVYTTGTEGCQSCKMLQPNVKLHLHEHT